MPRTSTTKRCGPCARLLKQPAGAFHIPKRSNGAKRSKWTRHFGQVTNLEGKVNYKLLKAKVAVVNDYIHKATSIVVKTCVEHSISKVVVGDVVKSLNQINEELKEPTKIL